MTLKEERDAGKILLIGYQEGERELILQKLDEARELAKLQRKQGGQRCLAN